MSAEPQAAERKCAECDEPAAKGRKRCKWHLSLNLSAVRANRGTGAKTRACWRCGAECRFGRCPFCEG